MGGMRDDAGDGAPERRRAGPGGSPLPMRQRNVKPVAGSRRRCRWDQCRGSRRLMPSILTICSASRMPPQMTAPPRPSAGLDGDGRVAADIGALEDLIEHIPRQRRRPRREPMTLVEVALAAPLRPYLSRYVQLGVRWERHAGHSAANQGGQQKECLGYINLFNCICC